MNGERGLLLRLVGKCATGIGLLAVGWWIGDPALGGGVALLLLAVAAWIALEFLPR